MKPIYVLDYTNHDGPEPVRAEAFRTFLEARERAGGVLRLHDQGEWRVYANKADAKADKDGGWPDALVATIYKVVSPDVFVNQEGDENHPIWVAAIRKLLESMKASKARKPKPTKPEDKRTREDLLRENKRLVSDVADLRRALDASWSQTRSLRESLKSIHLHGFVINRALGMISDEMDAIFDHIQEHNL